MPLSALQRAFALNIFVLWLVFNFQIKRRTELHTSLNHHFTTAFWQSRGPKSPCHSKHLDASTILLLLSCLPVSPLAMKLWKDDLSYFFGWSHSMASRLNATKVAKKLISNLSEKIAEKVHFWSTIPRCLIAGVMDVPGCRNSKDANYFLSGHQKKNTTISLQIVVVAVVMWKLHKLFCVWPQ